MRQCFPSVLPMQLGILQISLNSSEVSEVGTVFYIYWLQYLPNGFSGLTYNALYCILSIPKKKYPKDASNSPLARHLKQTSFLGLPEM